MDNPTTNNPTNGVRPCSSLPPSKADPELDAPRRFALELERGDPAFIEQILALLSEGPMKPAALRAAAGRRRGCGSGWS